MRKTKIVCTLGPASNNKETIKLMIENGMNVARINFSHGDYESHGRTIDLIKEVREELGKPCGILLDTKGPEIRTGDFKDVTILKAGNQFVLRTGQCLGNENECTITYKDLPNQLKQGDIVLIDDGKIKLKVISLEEDKILTEIVTGGKVSNHKGINVPDISLNMEYLSEKDKRDLEFGILKDVDFVAASFIRRSDDVKALRSFLNEKGGNSIQIISKIENSEGIENFEEILNLSDGIMVARGDMGVEVDFERLPGIQKKMIKLCNLWGKPVITATQMLESMIENPIPTRAETTDVANAVFDGTSSVMLSGESAMGKYPIEAVKAMAKIAEQAEFDQSLSDENYRSSSEMDDKDTTNAVGHAACTLAEDIKAKGILAITKSGYTAMKMSKFKPTTSIIGVTPHKKTYQQLSLYWGVYPIMVENVKDLDLLIRKSMMEALKQSMVSPGDKVVISAGVPLDVKGNTNMIRVEKVPNFQKESLSGLGNFL